jgi:hypothetical protein
MFGLQHSGCHSRENGNPETKIDTPGFPASSAGQALLEFIPMKIGAGMTNPKNTTLNLRSLKICRKCQANLPFLPRIRLIWTAMDQERALPIGVAPYHVYIVWCCLYRPISLPF